ncbi:MerR family transcriptional regulator [Candidatus Thiodiazotropha sp. CDECU1]|uniref:MerR family transcriptional regulator n=1 Tax=Candidatus Thiodiazotropha sp. CDECU1 TaxID=3065865 RepID=UPI00292E1124|nr:helix-turn-helix domain-containing protein [Candidatus Thiodiazotropha sp. CDECU1]
MNRRYSIGQMAEAGNCKVQTIRYYEQIGLLPEPERSEGNQRIYHQNHLDRLGFVRHSRELGFSLDRIREILAISDDPSHSCEEVDQIARSHLQEVESKIKRLQSMRMELKRMINQCAGNQVADCRIIEILSDHSLCLSGTHSSQ